MYIDKLVFIVHFGALGVAQGDIRIYIYMAAAQNVRSGSSPGPTNDPDL